MENALLIAGWALLAVWYVLVAVAEVRRRRQRRQVEGTLLYSVAGLLFQVCVGVAATMTGSTIIAVSFIGAVSGPFIGLARRVQARRDAERMAETKPE